MKFQAIRLLVIVAIVSLAVFFLKLAWWTVIGFVILIYCFLFVSGFMIDAEDKAPEDSLNPKMDEKEFKN
jgi:Ca2+/Na+ antiporter